MGKEFKLSKKINSSFFTSFPSFEAGGNIMQQNSMGKPEKEEIATKA